MLDTKTAWSSFAMPGPNGFRQRLCAWLGLGSHGLELTLSSYADYLRSQLLGPALNGYDSALRTFFDARVGEAIAEGPRGLAKLMAVEAQLFELLDDAAIERRYWIVWERFGRVGSAQARAAYSDLISDGLIPVSVPASIASARVAAAEAERLATEAAAALEAAEGAVQAGATATAAQAAAIAEAKIRDALASARKHAAAALVLAFETEAAAQADYTRLEAAAVAAAADKEAAPNDSAKATTAQDARSAADESAKRLADAIAQRRRAAAAMTQSGDR